MQYHGVTAVNSKSKTVDTDGRDQDPSLGPNGKDCQTYSAGEAPMQYDLNWERTISEDTKREFDPELRDFLDSAHSMLADKQSVSVRLNWSPDDVYNEVIVGEVWCGDALLWRVKGTTQKLVWTEPADD